MVSTTLLHRAGRHALAAEPSIAVLDRGRPLAASPSVAVIWIDWYAYHIARFRALTMHPLLRGRATGIELVGGAGVHGGLVFRANEREGLPIVTLLPDSGWSEAGQVRLARLLWKKLDQLVPEVVLVPGYYTLPGLASVLWARRFKKIAILMTESTRQDHVRKPFIEWIKRTVLRRLFDGAVAGGKPQVAYLKELGFEDSKIAGCYDVVDNEYFTQQVDDCRGHHLSSTLPGLPNRYFLYVGRLAKEKNIDGLIRVFARYRERGGNQSLVLVGDGPLAGSLREQVEAEGLADSVHFAGLKDTREIIPYYAFAHWFVLPSWREPWGLVVNEAMASGLPIILSERCGCSDDLLDNGSNGFLFNPAREEDLLRVLLEATNMTEQKRQQMGQRSREIISHYSPQLWAEEVLRICKA